MTQNSSATSEDEPSAKSRKENCLFIRYRHRKPPKRDEIRLLHPSIVDVRLPRQKSAKFCHLEFDSKEAARKALKEIRKEHGKDILVKAFGRRTPNASESPASPDKESSDEEDDDSEEEPVVKKPKAQGPKQKQEPRNKQQESTIVTPDEPSKCLRVSGLPLLAPHEVLKSLFPNSTQITVSEPTSGPQASKKRHGFVHFGSIKEARTALESSKGVSVNGEVLTVTFHG